MKYGLYYKEVEFNDNSRNTVKRALSSNLKWDQGKVLGKKSSRSSNVAWVRDQQLLSMLFRMAKQINKDTGWNLNITGIEPVQFGIYGEDDYYGWHADQHAQPVRGMVRKISMSLFLNDDYEGGEFDLEIYKPETDPRYKTFKLSSWSAIFFQGDYWHRVRPVTSGKRKSLVAWFYGPPYI